MRMVEKGWLGLALTIAAGSLAACGPNSPACGSFAACGGTIIGTWKKVLECDAVIDSACPTETRMIKQESTASVTFNSDLTFDMTNSAFEYVVMTPKTCLGAMECGELFFGGIPCTSDTTDCVCDTKGPENQLTGTYSTSGSKLTLVAGGGISYQADFCAQGNTLRFDGLVGDSPGTYAVFSKQ